MTQPYPLYPNIKIVPLPPTETRFTSKVIHPALEPIVYELAVRHPSWVFSETAARVNGEIAQVSGFEIRHSESDARLGRIEVSRNYGARHNTPWVFDIWNPRISSFRERGDTYSTGDPKKAVKAVNKYFSPPSVAEKVAEIKSRAQTAVSNHLHMTREKRDRVLHQIDPWVSNYVDTHWSDIVAGMKEEVRAIAETVPAIKQEFNSVEELYANINASKHLTVLISGDTYITYDGANMTTYTTDTLPAAIKTKVGLLKLMDSGTVLPDVGVKIGDSGFVIDKSAIDS